MENGRQTTKLQGNAAQDCSPNIRYNSKNVYQRNLQNLELLCMAISWHLRLVQLSFKMKARRGLVGMGRF